ncbi:M23 family metallopeptidase [Arsenicitalea aurantiaca]|uniref:M23 family metallopeptidase n=1 Tax=Arsenicitalea aurantiaca TaxID=1783274 RepID=UPI00131560DB|nr:M23 family metallopeptidase [Arsenicitalea aurantiaca]
MNPAQRNRHAALLKASGYEDGPALTVQSTDGEIPHGRELSFAWLTGTVMTGLTSVLLMGAALYVSFEGQDTFSTAYEALNVYNVGAPTATDLRSKTDRVRPIAQTRSEREIIEASIRENVDGRDMIRRQPFVRLRATLATAATSLSDDVPGYDPVAILSANEPITESDDDGGATQIYSADVDVEGEVSIRLAALPMTLVPPRAISDQSAAQFVRMSVENVFSEGLLETSLAYAPANEGLRDLGIVSGNAISGIAENVTVLPKTTLAEESGLGRTERILTVREAAPIEEILLKNGFTNQMISAIGATLRNVYPSTTLPAGARLRILFGPSRTSDTLIPYRMSIYVNDRVTNTDKHAVTVALTDRGQYVLGIAPSEIEFPEEDTEEINVANLPSVYRSIWETARKHDLDDATTERIIAMFAYDVEMTRRIAPGDTIEILQTPEDDAGNRDLLYVSINLGGTKRELFRYRTPDGVVDFYDADGETGKRFLIRRPLEGGGRLSSRFGYRVHPIFKTRRLHTGTDFAARAGTPIFAAGDGTVGRAQWVSGYGRYVEIEHVNGFETAYAHMSRIADGISPGTRVRQGQIIGYVGSTGNSTGNHLHFEIKVNGRFVDPLSVRLPRDKSLPPQFEQDFRQSIAQVRDLMQRDPAPITVADGSR